jgi:hypothetical protein
VKRNVLLEMEKAMPMDDIKCRALSRTLTSMKRGEIARFYVSKDYCKDEAD